METIKWLIKELLDREGTIPIICIGVMLVALIMLVVVSKIQSGSFW